MRLSPINLRREWDCAKKAERRKMLIACLILIAVILFCQCFRYNAYFYEDKFQPAANFKSLWLAIRLFVGKLFHLSIYGQKNAAIEAVGGSIIYLGALARLKMTLVSLVAGAGLCISGAIFQTAYQNPLASPNMIGATAGVNLGNILVIMLYSVQAYEHIFLRYKFCYGFTALCIGVTLLLGRLAGDKRKNSSVLEMVMIGSIASQFCNVVSMYIMYAMLSDEDLILYQEIRMGTELDTDWQSMLVFFVTMAVTILPMLLMRYRMNALGMERMETTALGIRIGPMRLIAQICGGVMVTCTMIHCGEIGMVSMIIPYVVRQIAGSDFRKVLIYSAVSGAVLLMICRLLTSLIYVAGEPLPVSFLVSMILVPVFMVILVRNGRREADAVRI